MEVTQPQSNEPPSAHLAKFIRLDTRGRKLWMIQADKLTALSSLLATIQGPRTLLILDAKAEWDIPAAFDLAHAEITRGLRYLCAWGPKAPLLENIFDEEFVVLELDHQWPGDPVLMTTSHTDQSWESALTFFLNAAQEANGWPTPCEHRIVAVIGDHDMPAQIEALLALDHWDA